MIPIQIIHMMEFIGHMVVPVTLLSLVISWKSINARWFLLIFLTVNLVDSLMVKTALSWGDLYFLWAMFENLVIIFAILLRRLIARGLQQVSRNQLKDFFKACISSHEFKAQEGVLVGLCTISFMINFGGLFEGVLRSIGLIDNVPFRHVVIVPTQFILHVLSAFAVLRLAFNSVNEREK